MILGFLTLCLLKTPKQGVLVNIEDQGEMQHNAVFHHGLHCCYDLNNLKGQKYIIILEM